MLAKKYRLSRELIQRHLEKGGVEKLYTPLFSVIYKENKDILVGIAVSKKVLQTAVKRNLLRRRVYVVFQQVIPQFKKGGILLLQYKNKGSIPKTEEIHQDITKMLKNKGLL